MAEPIEPVTVEVVDGPQLLMAGNFAIYNAPDGSAVAVISTEERGVERFRIPRAMIAAMSTMAAGKPLKLKDIMRLASRKDDV